MISNKEFKPALDKAEIAFTAGQPSVARASAHCDHRVPGPREPYKRLRQAILFETGLFIKRIPDLLKLSFSDGSPSAMMAQKNG